MSTFRVPLVALAMLASAAAARGADREGPWPADVPGFKAPEAGEHPRLFFRKADLPKIKERAQTPEGKAIVARLRFLLNGSDGETLPEMYNPTRADKEGSGDFHKSAPVGKAYTLWHGTGYGMLFHLTGDAKYADLGRQCVEKALDGQRDRDDRYSFVGPHGALRAGPSIGAVAMAYDLCYDGWDEDFRRKVAGALQNYNQGPNESLGELAQGKRHGPHSNHWGPQIGGGALALLAIRNDPGVDNAVVEKLLEANAKTMTRHVTEGFGDGGYFQEHAGPGQIASDTAYVPAVQAWRVAGGKDFITPRPNVPAITLVRAYEMFRFGDQTSYMLRHPSSYGSGTYPDDRNGLSRGGQFAQGFGAVRDEHKPALLWVYNHLVEPDPAQRTFDAVSPYPHRAVLALVNWPIPAGEKAERNPADVLPKVHRDKLKGYFVFRNQWKDQTDVAVSMLFGARSERSPSEVMIWGHGMKLSFGRIKTPLTVTAFEAKDDGSGVVSAGKAKAYFAADFSRKSGADAVVVIAGAGGTKGKDAKGRNGATATFHEVSAGGMSYWVCTVQAGEAPEVKAEGDRVRVGGQTVSFDGEKLVLGP